MRQWLMIIVAALSCALAGCVTEDEPEGADLHVGDRVPEFSVTLDDGRVFGTSLLKSGTGHILFFNTDCPDCRRELPVMQKLYDSLPEQEKARFACVARDEDDATIAAYWKTNSLTMPYSAQPDRQVFNLFATYTIPRLYITRDGAITEIQVLE